MSNTTVEQFAAELKRSVDDLLKQLKSAGVEKNSGSDGLTWKIRAVCAITCKRKTVMKAAVPSACAVPEPKKALSAE